MSNKDNISESNNADTDSTSTTASRKSYASDDAAETRKSAGDGRKSGKKHKKDRTKRIVLCIILIAVLIEAGIFIAQFVRLREYKGELSEKEQVFDELRADDKSGVDAGSDSDGSVAAPSHDFEAAWQENGDVHAFVTVPGTKVDYPILQNEEDDYYLMRNLDLSEGYPGCIYTNSINSKDFSDPLTVIYGHNMRNKTMFGTLHEFDDSDFINEHKNFTIETPEKLLTYDICAVVNFTDDNITYYFDPKDTASVTAFMQSIKKESNGKSPAYIDENANVTDDDKLVVLSTCIAKEKDRRLLIVGKLSNEVNFENPVTK